MDHLYTSPRFLAPAQQLRLSIGVLVELYRPRSDDRLHLHAHPNDCINLVLDGSLHERVEDVLHTVPSGSLSVLPRATHHAVHVAGRNAQVLHLEFEPAFMGRFPTLDRSRFKFVSWLDANTRGLAQRANATLLHPDAHSSQMLEALCIEAMVLAVRRAAQDVRDAGIPEGLAMLVSRMRADPGQAHQLSTAAAEIGISPAALSRQFRRHFGMRLQDYLLSQRVDAACRQLSETQQSLAQIATNLGFADQSHFCRSFQRVLGLAPSAYRRLAR
jgi:AraC family transcriptional regulator